MPRDLLIDGSWVKTAESHQVRRPYDKTDLDTVALASHADIERALLSCQKAFEKVKSTPGFERAQRLLAVAALLEKRRFDFAQILSEESGKPIALADGEVARAIDTFTAAAEAAREDQIEGLSLDAFAPGKNHVGISRRFPLGVIYGITPFNFPLNLVAHKVAPCIATNNVMLLKPALKTPLTSYLLGEILLEAGVPAGQINIVTCTHEVADYLIEDPRIQKISFTGSPAIGWKLKSRCGTKRITLELGGNAAVVVHSDADWKKAIPTIAVGSFSNAGQSCISVQRILIHESLYSAFQTEFVQHVEQKIKSGNPNDPQTLVGPMIDSTSLNKTLEWIDEAVKNGAQILCGGKSDGTVLPPTVLSHVTHQSKIYCEEAFAPVVILESYSSFDEALSLVNESSYGLQAGVFTQDIQRIWKSFETLEVGGVLINQVPTFRTENMPYGGSKLSGFGREGVRYAMEEMTELRSLILNIGN
ncbi:MAG: aldehyde dehydrogenase family protein [Verrucomicrobiota bacterium]